ncbi:probable disease resistance protein At1g58602 [Salvia miltiorrhiza]|uniref:probable disease resistance protein At1g58602 n=1 Tax=Salvia miltiorrhiza TaxID=226208 RepID=UPI0025ABF98C|nr:probable disease resistance protein At1g58602 [Salvia miltiorrhiza]
MVDSFANVFLETLSDLMVEEIEHLVGARDEVEQAKRDLKTIHGLLMKADEERNSPTLKDHVAQLKDLAFKAENVLETYAVRVAFNNEEKLERYICILRECYSAHEVRNDSRDIISRLSFLTRSLESELGEEISSRQMLAHREVERDHFVGMQRDIEMLASMVKDETRVVKIYGMGGLGKTTLARKIYEHRDLRGYARAWVCITRRFRAKAVFGEILRQLEGWEFIDNSKSGDELVRGIYRFLKERKGLIVIDDIWENYHWDIIKKALPMDSCSVLLTTRDSESVSDQESDIHPYKLGFLREDEGWELLRKIALPQDFGAGETLEGIGREIVVKCGCLPLAISVIGGILRHKEGNLLAEWKKVNMSLRHGEGVEEYKRVKQVLELSYDALPYYLKPCFLYLACFPKDEEIKTERLYRLWMAKGFISIQDKGPSETLRDVAERYLTQLATRFMVQVQKGKTHSPLHKFESCRLHDSMHHLCSSKAQEEELERIDIHSSICNSMSRLAISVRSLCKGGVSFERIGIEDSVERSSCSRILDFEGEKLPRKVRKLIHLRHLSLSSVRELPKFVCSMPYLQTLDLRASCMKLPNVIWKMKRLKHLFLPSMMEVIGGEKLRLDGLDELEALQDIYSSSGSIEDIPKLISLQELSATVFDADSLSAVAQHMMSSNGRRSRSSSRLVVALCDFSWDFFKNVLMCPSLVSLRVSDCNSNGVFPCYEEGMGENLVDLNIQYCSVGGEDVMVMEELGKYPMLQSLWLQGMEVGGKTETLIFSSNSFAQLECLDLHKLHGLRKWEVEEGAMPRLAKLVIRSCWNLEKVPNGLRFIVTLRRLNIFKMPKEFNDRIRIGGEDYGTVSHIPFLYIYGL